MTIQAIINPHKKLFDVWNLRIRLCLDTERSDKSNTNIEGIELVSGSTLVSGLDPRAALQALHSGLGPTLVLIPDLVPPSWLVLSIYHACGSNHLRSISDSGSPKRCVESLIYTCMFIVYYDIADRDPVREKIMFWNIYP